MLNRERGATAITLAAAMVLLIGMAAIAIDISAGFNERNQDQSAADNAVMSGAIEVSEFAPSSDVTTEALLIARSNLDTEFGDPTNPADPEWVELWRSCTDPDKDASFFPMAEPISWSGVVTATPSTGTLDCVSRSASQLRVRIPDQAVATSFSQVVGVSSLQTSAVAVALIGPDAASAPIVPYGIAGGFGSGEACFGSAPTGTSFPPCNGASSGAFGTLLSEFFGDFYGTVDCGNPGAIEIATATAIGIDHFIEIWPNTAGITAGDPHPGDGTVLALSDTNRDACDAVGGAAVPVDGPPLNTVRVDTGFPSSAMEDGLVSNLTFQGQPSRLQQKTNLKRPIVAVRAGVNETIWDLDNKGPWEYLVGGSGIPECNPGGPYNSLPLFDADPLVDTKVSRFDKCLKDYALAGTTVDLFDLTLEESPRLVWAPEYWYDLSTTGLSWQPVQTYRVAFIGGTFYNCNAGGCDITHYPDTTEMTELCDTSGGGCQQLTLDQFSAWVLPTEAVPDEILNKFPGGITPGEIVLFE